MVAFFMILSFFANFFSRSVQSSSSFAKMFLYEKKACSYIDKVYFAAVYKKKNIFTVAF